MRQVVLEKENSEFKPVKLPLKIDLVSYPAQVAWLVNMDWHDKHTKMDNHEYGKRQIGKLMLTDKYENT